MASPAMANFNDSATQRVGDLKVDLLVVPSSFVLEHPPEHTGPTMHGAPGASRFSHHLIAAVFIIRSGVRVGDASVNVVVAGSRYRAQRTQLEPMLVAGAATYGGFATMPPLDTYRITVEVGRENSKPPVTAVFWHRHWQP